MGTWEIEDMDEKQSQEKASQASSSSVAIGYGILESPESFTIDEDVDEKYTSSSSTLGGVDSDEEEDVPLLEDESVEGGQGHTESPPPSVARKSFMKAEHKIALSHFIRIFSYSTATDRLLIGVAAFASICTGVTLPLMNIVFGELVGVFSALYDPESVESEEVFTQTMNKYVLYMVYLFFARLVLGYIAILGFRIASLRISASIRLTYLRALMAQPVSVLDTLPPGQTASIITITANILQLGISEKLSLFLQSLSLVVTAFMVAFYYNWLLTIVTSAGLLFIVISYCITVPYLVSGLKAVEEADKLGASVASEVFEMVRMVAACGAEGKMAKKYQAWVEESKRRGFLMSPVVAVQQAPAFFAVHATFALSFWYAIRLYLESAISNVTVIIIILTSIMTIVTSIGGIAGPMTAAAHAASAAGILFTIIDAPQPKTNGTKQSSDLDSQDIVLENINFGYPMRPDLRILQNLNVRFPAGKTTAIVGASGSGKSTIVGLLERWYELDGALAPEAMHMFSNPGKITVGGQNIREFDLTWWRSQIGLVQQEPFLFNTTIFTNVEYGLIGTKWEFASQRQKKKLVEQACKEAFADEFIARLPEGYNTILGDAGIQLSGGQRQRLAIARAMIKAPSILILDEATSSVDIHSEKIIQLALDRISKNRTTITIAHRLSTIMKADNIIVLKQGNVIQQGSHEQLMKDVDGDYWRLASAQQLSLSENSTTESRSLDPEKQTYSQDGAGYLDEEFEMVPSSKSSIKQTEPVLGNFILFLWEQRYQWKWYCVMILGSLGAGASLPIHAFLFAKLISLFNLWGQVLRDQTSFWCLMLLCLAIGVAVSYFILGWSSNVVSFQVTATYRKQYFHDILQKPISYHDNPSNSVGALTSLLASDPTHLQQLLGINMAIVLISLFTILLSILLALYFGFKLALLSIFTSMPIILLSGYFRLHYERRFEKMTNEVFRESAMFASEAIGAFRTVSSLGMEESVFGRYEGLLKGLIGGAEVAWSTFVFAVSDSSALLCMAFILWYGGQLLASREYAPFNYMVVYLAIVQGSSAAGASLSFGPNIASAFAAANRIREMRPSPNSEEETGLSESFVSQENEKCQGVKIELKNLSFKYPTRDVPVLTNLNMTIQPGQFAAIVGPSGSGKTSILSLIERFYNPSSGIILCSNTPISSIPLSDYRSKLSLVAQEASLFSGSIRENILLGLPEQEAAEFDCQSCIKKDTQERERKMIQASKESGIHDFITSLPEGYETCVGARGVNLSGGQKQRISIARALIRSPSLLLLDEATSSLDSQTEAEVMNVFLNPERAITRIVVAHRLATVQNADVIFVLGAGGEGVVEQGTHGELVARRGVYWEMCRGQVFGG